MRHWEWQAILVSCSVLVGVFCASAQLRPVEYNREELVMISVQGAIAPPTLRNPPFRVDPEGRIGVFPGTGGITYNFRTGDSAVHLAADHVEPAVSVYRVSAGQDRENDENVAFNVLSCIGNEARVITGDAKGERGWVIGKHGGAEHVMVDFAPEVFDRLVIGDRIQIRALGTGMELSNAPGVTVMNAAPRLLEALSRAVMGITPEGKLRIPVTHRIPAKIMGSGLGRRHVYKGDYDIQLFDAQVVEEHGLESLRFGDMVAITDADHTYGRIYLGGAISVGVVVHSRSFVAGHGPGVTTLFTSREGNIETVIDAEANLKTLLAIP